MPCLFGRAQPAKLQALHKKRRAEPGEEEQMGGTHKPAQPPACFELWWSSSRLVRSTYKLSFLMVACLRSKSISLYFLLSLPGE